jgi:hypothetical protein
LNKRFVDAHHIRHWIDGGETTLQNLTLLCSHHHRALHEGRFRIRRDESGVLYFVRPDGRVIPKAGYRLDDMLDDDVDGEQSSAEGFGRSVPFASALEGRNPSAEVRETAAVYLVG